MLGMFGLSGCHRLLHTHPKDSPSFLKSINHHSHNLLIHGHSHFRAEHHVISCGKIQGEWGRESVASYLAFHCLLHKNTWKQVFVNSHLTSLVVLLWIMPLFFSLHLQREFHFFFVLLSCRAKQCVLYYYPPERKEPEFFAVILHLNAHPCQAHTLFVTARKYYPSATTVKNSSLYFSDEMSWSVGADPHQCKPTVQRGLNVPDKSFHFGQFPNINISAWLLTWHK